MTAPDSYYFARALAGVATDAETAQVSASFRPLFGSTLKLIVGRRAKHLRKGLTKLVDDVDASMREIADVEPDGPAPEADDEDLDPVRLSTLAPVEPFPVEVLPGTARELAESIAEAVPTRVDFAAVAILGVASIAIGRSAVFQIKEGWEAQAALYLAMIGRSSDGKSVALKKAIKPLDEIQIKLFLEYEEAYQFWSAKTKEKDRGPEPVARRIITTDATKEAMGTIQANNRRGIALRKDEMIGWFGSFDEYRQGSGSDLSHYLSGWDGDISIVDRSKNKGAPILIPNSFITLLGGLVPSSVPKLAGGGNHINGLMQRILYCYPDRPTGQRWGTPGVPHIQMQSWRSLIDRLLERTALDGENYLKPHVVHLDENAKALWAEWGPRNLAEKNAPAMTEALASTWGKFEDQLGRLTLILHLLRLAQDPEADPTDPIPLVDAQTAADAIRLVEYFKSHARRVFSICDVASPSRTGPPRHFIQSLRRWLKESGVFKFTGRDAIRGCSIPAKDKAEFLDTLAYLGSPRIGATTKIEPEPGQKGRKPKVLYRVNPEFLHERFDLLG